MNNERIYGQTCQDEALTQRFRDFHVKLVNEIIEFMSNNNIHANEFHLHADGLGPSIDARQWTPYTDSGFEVYSDDDTEPYLFSM